MINIPFSGSKKYSYKLVNEIAKKGNYNIVYEPFGGSGVLSINLYNDGLVEKAIINDYDHFFDDYENYLDLKDKVVEEGYKKGLRRTTCHPKGAKRYNSDGSYEIIKSPVLSLEDRKILQDIISKKVPEKYWRYFSLGFNFTYSAVSSHEVIKLNDFTFFNSQLKTEQQRKYLNILNKLTVENLDYSDFLKKYKKEFSSDSLLIIDPPYPNDQQKQYQGTFSEEEAKILIKELNDLPSDFIYFHSDLNDLNNWFKGIDYSVKSFNKCTINKKDYLVYVHKTH